MIEITIKTQFATYIVKIHWGVGGGGGGGCMTWIQQDNSNEDGRMTDTTIKMQFATYLGCTEGGWGWGGGGI